MNDGLAKRFRKFYERNMRFWTKKKYEDTGKRIYFWISLLFDIFIILFIIYFALSLQEFYSITYAEIQARNKLCSGFIDLNNLSNLTDIAYNNISNFLGNIK